MPEEMEHLQTGAVPDGYDTVSPEVAVAVGV